MHKEKYVFAQLVKYLNNDKFRRIVAKYQGDKYVKHFTCWNQLLALMFGQLCNRESLRDLISALDAHHGKCYHLGIGKNVSKLIWHTPTKYATVASLKSSPTMSLMKQDANVQL